MPINMFTMFKKVSDVDKAAKKLEELCKEGLRLERHCNDPLFKEASLDEWKALAKLTPKILQQRIVMEKARLAQKQNNPVAKDSVQYLMADGFVNKFLGQAEERQKFNTEVNNLIRHTKIDVNLPKVDVVEMDLEKRFNKLMGYQQTTIEELEKRLENLKRKPTNGHGG